MQFSFRWFMKFYEFFIDKGWKIVWVSKVYLKYQKISKVLHPFCVFKGDIVKLNKETFFPNCSQQKVQFEFMWFNAVFRLLFKKWIFSFKRTFYYSSQTSLEPAIILSEIYSRERIPKIYLSHSNEMHFVHFIPWKHFNFKQGSFEVLLP